MARSAIPRALSWTVMPFVALLALLLLTLLVLQHADLRGPVARWLEVRNGAPVRIEGDLELRLLTLTPRAVVGGLELDNPAWAGGGRKGRVERATVELRLLPLFKGDIVLPRVILERPEMYVLRQANGRTNWGGTRSADRAPTRAARELPTMHELVIREGRVRLVDRVRGLTLRGVVAASEVPSIDGAPSMRLASHGELNGQPYRLELTGGPLGRLQRDRPYPFHLQVDSGGTHAIALGTLVRPFDLRRYQAGISLSGDDFAELFYLTGLALPNTPPYRVTGHVNRSGTRLTLRGLSGRVGDSDIRADATIELAGQRPMLMAQVSSESLDLDDLGVPLGAAPSVRKGEAASPEQRARANEMRARAKLFPDAKLQVRRLRAMDAYVQFEASAVQARRVPLRQVRFHLQLDDGMLTLDPVSFELRQGRLAGTARIDARQDLPKTILDARLTGLQLGQFRPRNAEQAPFEGALVGRARIEGYGRSVHEFASTAHGELTLVLPQGEVREVFAELTGVNVARGLGLLVRGDQDQTTVRCGVADFGIERGTLHAENIVFDTENVFISGGGQIHLGREAYDLTIKGHPKKFRLLRVRSPIAIRGPLRKPDVGLETGESLAQTGVAAALAALVAPLAGVLAFVDPGLADDANCAALLTEAKREGAPIKQSELTRARRG